MKKGACLALLFTLLFTLLFVAGCGPHSVISAKNNAGIPVIVAVAEAKGSRQTISLNPGESTQMSASPSSYHVTARAKADYAKELLSARDYLEDRFASLQRERSTRYSAEWDEAYGFIKKLDEKITDLAFGSTGSASPCSLLVEYQDTGGEGFCSQEGTGTNGIVEVNQSPDGALILKCRTEAYQSKGCQ
jgi:hypothetical protein